jgi:hypothetical protein
MTRHSIWAGALALVVLVLGAPALAQQLPPAAVAYIQTQRIIAYSTSCRILSPLQHQGIYAAAAEYLSQVPFEMANNLKLLSADHANAMYNRPCTGAEAEAAKVKLRQQAQSDVTLQLLRGDALLRAEAAGPWATNLTTLSSHRALLSDAAAKARAANPAGGAAFSALDQQAAYSLRVICSGRRTVRAPTPRACPAVAQSELAQRDAGRLFVEQAEEFAARHAELSPQEASLLPRNAAGAYDTTAHCVAVYVFLAETGGAAFNARRDLTRQRLNDLAQEMGKPPAEVAAKLVRLTARPDNFTIARCDIGPGGQGF